jgi:dTDP-glucose 4,6-dehydratase
LLQQLRSLPFPRKADSRRDPERSVGKGDSVYGKGENVRDWLYVEDHADALLTVLEKGPFGRSYNIGGENEARNIDIVRTICAPDGRNAPRRRSA